MRSRRRKAITMAALALCIVGAMVVLALRAADGPRPRSAEAQVRPDAVTFASPSPPGAPMPAPADVPIEPAPADVRPVLLRVRVLRLTAAGEAGLRSSKTPAWAAALDAGPVALAGDDASQWSRGNGPLPQTWHENALSTTIALLPGQPARLMVDGRSPVGGEEISVSVRAMEAPDGGYDLSMTASVLSTKDAVGEVLADVGLLRPGPGGGRWLLRPSEVGVARIRHMGDTYWFVVQATSAPRAGHPAPALPTAADDGDEAPADAGAE